MELLMNLHILLLSLTFTFSAYPMLRPTAVVRVPRRPCPVLKPMAARPSETEKLKVEKALAEQQAHKARQEAEFWKQQALRCQKHGCTQVCIAHAKNNCSQEHREEKQKALRAFYRQQGLDHRIPIRPLKPTAQKIW